MGKLAVALRNAAGSLIVFLLTVALSFGLARCRSATATDDVGLPVTTRLAPMVYTTFLGITGLASGLLVWSISIARQQAEAREKSLLEQLEIARKNLAIEVVRLQQMKSAEAAVEQSRREALTCSAAKSEFLAKMSHQIRTPVSAIIGFSDLLTESLSRHQPSDSVFNDCQDYLQTISGNAQHVLEIIDDILDLSKIEAGTLAINNVTADLAKIVNDVVALTKLRAEAKGLRIIVDLRTALPVKLHTDPLRMRQILFNLVSAAIKATVSGEIRIALAQNESTQQLSIQVQGRRGQAESSSFSSPDFSSFDSGQPTQVTSTELGIVLSERIARQMDGELQEFKSADGQATFVLSIAADPNRDAFQQPNSAARAMDRQSNSARIPPGTQAQLLKGLRILLAEDGIDNQRLIAHVLRRTGATVEIADDGEEALRMLSQTMANKSDESTFQLLLTDMQMPIKDGYTLVRQLRSQGCDIPVIAITACAMREDFEKCIACGCNAYLSKPVDIRNLIAVCEQWAAKSADLFSDQDLGQTRLLPNQTDCAAPLQ